MPYLINRNPGIVRTPIAALSFAAMAVLATATLTGCASQNQSAQTMPPGGTQSLWKVDYGEVVDLRPIKVEGQASLLGILVGATAGSVAAREVSGSRVAGAVGGLAGAAAGAAVERSVTGKNAQQITVELDGGSTVAIVQDDQEQFQNGERVRVLTANIATAAPVAVSSGGIWGHSSVIGAGVPLTRARVQKL